MRRASVFWPAALLALSAFSAPQLKPQPELVADGELKARVLAGAEGVPAPTPQARQYRMTRGAETKEVRWYVPADIWRARAFAGEWKDRKGNVMRLARVKSLVPSFEREDWYREEIEKALDGLEKEFKGTEEELAAWKRSWGGPGTGRFVETKRGDRYWVEFEIAEFVKEGDVERLLKAFEKSVSTMTKSGGNVSSMKWWETTNPQYRFLTDLDRAKGSKFVKDAMRQMEAMRKGYEFYVPPQKALSQCTVRVFRDIAGYREYRASTGVRDGVTSGLWDPSRDELLVSADNPRQAQETMRHEAFHQYLHYATGRGDHALWFNEGHATFFENVRFNVAKNTIQVTDEGNRAMWVAKDPVRHANHMTRLLALTPEQFMSGDLNLNYCTAWALVYFLEKGAYTTEDFAPYRGVCAKYLELMKEGLPPELATARAFEPVARRNLAADFLRFWKEKRKAALKVR